MADLSKEARELCEGVKKIMKDHKGINEAFSQYLAHERFILESGMDEEEERRSRDLFAGAYGRDLEEFDRLVDEEMKKRLIGDPDIKRQVLEELGCSEAMEDYHSFAESTKEDYPLNQEGISEEQQMGVHDFHRWLYRNCDKSGFAYMGSRGSVREYADSFMKKSGKDQLRALYILEKGLGDEPDAVERADAALESYVPDLKSIKDQMIRSKFRVLARTDGTQFKWNRLSGALNMVTEANEEKAREQEEAQAQQQIRPEAGAPGMGQIRPEAGMQGPGQIWQAAGMQGPGQTWQGAGMQGSGYPALWGLAAETGIPRDSLGRYLGAVGTMYRDMAGLNQMFQQRPMPSVSPEVMEAYLAARNRQMAMVNRSSRDVLRTAESDSRLDRIMKPIETTSEMTDAVLNLYYAYSVAGMAHQAARGFRMGAKTEDEIETVYSSLFGALGGENERLLTVSESAMDLGLGVLTAVSSGAAAISDFRELIQNRDVVRKTENWKRSFQVGQDVSYAVGGGASAAGAIGNIVEAAGSTLNVIGKVSGATDLAAGGIDMVMGGMDIVAGVAQRKRAKAAKENAGKLKDVTKKAELRGAAKTAKRRNKWKIGQGILTAVKGALCVAGGVLALTVAAPAVGIAVAAAGTAALVAQIYYSKQKERMANNKKAIDAQILAKDREIERNTNGKSVGEKKDPKTGKRTKAIEDKIQEHKKFLENKRDRYKEGSRQRKYLDQLLTDDKRIKHVIRTDAAVKMGCMTQEECRQKLDMQTIEKAFRHVYLKDPDGDFNDSNIITKEEADQYFVSMDSREDRIQNEKGSRQKVSGEEAVERITYRDILKSHGFKVKHHSRPDGKKMEERLEKVKSSMEK